MIFKFEILSYWRVGTGQERGGTLDAICARDHDGLPFVPGRQVRGLFREAVTRAVELEWCSIAPKVLFGDSQMDTGTGLSSATTPGCLRFDSAYLATAERAALLQNSELKSRLFDIKRSTAIDCATGTAKNRSLRYEEVAIPLMLFARVNPLPDVVENWDAALRSAAPLIRGLGNGRNRGLGRVVVSIEEGGIT